MFLGDPASPDAGIVELVQFDAADTQEYARTKPSRARFLLAVVLRRREHGARGLADLGLGGTPRRITVPAAGGGDVQMATVVDPDGVLVELIGLPAS